MENTKEEIKQAINEEAIKNPGDEPLEILSTSKEYPERELSNFMPYPFTLDGIYCGGMEGFLQSLKFFSKKRAAEVAALSGKAAKKAGESKLFWKITGHIRWCGRRIRRESEEFSRLIHRAYDEMYKQNPAFREALEASGERELSHKIGKNDKRKTILTIDEFLFELYRLRDKGKK